MIANKNQLIFTTIDATAILGKLVFIIDISFQENDVIYLNIKYINKNHIIKFANALEKFHICHNIVSK